MIAFDAPLPLSALEYEKSENLKSPSRTTLLFIHGMESSKETWLPVLEQLRGKYHLLAIDLRGHGDTPYGNGAFGISEMVADVNALVKEKKLERVILIAHSMGTRIAIAYASHHPEKVKGLFLEDMELIPRPEKILSKEDLTKLKGFKADYSTLEELYQELSSYGYPVEKIQSWVKQGRIVWNEKTQTYHSKVNPYVSYLAHNGCQASEVARHAFSKLKDYDFPVTLLQAEFDSSISNEGLLEMKTLHPKLKTHLVENSTHSIHKTQSEVFLNYLNAFLEKIVF